ncbi:MAG TPA: CmpA/NrtA family ABC transporter substrate-binding protein [Luteolibacter sp.]
MAFFPLFPGKMYSNPLTARQPIRLGFVPLNDCAPLAVARETGLFERYGVDVQLVRLPGWATVRDMLFFGELDAAQAIAGLAFSLTLGIGQLRRDVCVPLVLSGHGNAITLSKRIPAELIGRGEGLAGFIAHRWKENRPFTMAAAHRYSSHHLLLQSWLRQHGLQPGRDVELIFLPPPLMPGHMASGHLDGYCVGEPWNSESILSGQGWCVATSSQIASGHPEKVLVASGELAGERRQDLLALTAALLHACRLCQAPSFRDELIRILSSEQYTGASEAALRNSLGPVFETGNGQLDASSFHLFHGGDINCPTPDKASWFLAGMRAADLLPENTTGGSLTRIYRHDLYRAACDLLLPAA